MTQLRKSFRLQVKGSQCLTCEVLELKHALPLLLLLLLLLQECHLGVAVDQLTRHQLCEDALLLQLQQLARILLQDTQQQDAQCVSGVTCSNDQGGTQGAPSPTTYAAWIQAQAAHAREQCTQCGVQQRSTRGAAHLILQGFTVLVGLCQVPVACSCGSCRPQVPAVACCCALAGIRVAAAGPSQAGTLGRRWLVLPAAGAPVVCAVFGVPIPCVLAIIA